MYNPRVRSQKNRWPIATNFPSILNSNNSSSAHVYYVIVLTVKEGDNIHNVDKYDVPAREDS